MTRKSELSQKVKQGRLRAGLSIRQAARAAGLNERDYRAIEAGIIIPHHEHVKNINRSIINAPLVGQPGRIETYDLINALPPALSIMIGPVEKLPLSEAIHLANVHMNEGYSTADWRVVWHTVLERMPEEVRARIEAREEWLS